MQLIEKLWCTSCIVFLYIGKKESANLLAKELCSVKSQTTRPCHGVAPPCGRQSAFQAPLPMATRRMCRAVLSLERCCQAMSGLSERHDVKIPLKFRCSPEEGGKLEGEIFCQQIIGPTKKWAKCGSNPNQPRPQHTGSSQNRCPKNGSTQLIGFLLPRHRLSDLNLSSRPF